MSEILVLGAGMVGVSSALALQAQGHQVVLVDRHSSCRETSYGNAGVIQTEAAEPYALPRNLMTLFRYGCGFSNDVLWQPGALLRMKPALWRYFRHSAPAEHARISRIYSQLTSRAADDHAPLVAAAGAQSLISTDGLSEVYRQQSGFESAAKEAARFKEQYGISSRILDGATYREEEPALKQAPAGVIHWNESWSCRDPGALTDDYRALFLQRGGSYRQGDAQTLSQSAKGWRVEGESGPIEAEQVVIALGPWSPQLLRRFGYRIPMIYKRGYHGHFNAPLALKRPFLDADNGVVVASMAKGMRVTSGAALVALDSKTQPTQLERGAEALRSLVDLGERIDEPQWFGTRPCMPDMLPLVGAAPNHQGMWFNFGHGHQGFTLGPTTGQLLAEIMAGVDSEITRGLAPGTRL
ncbi:NAD(P)/FAD-dependent oxidoreductase [Marinobacterium lutimaris]|uniref:D-amino-acid dehydrogenase n=1 Tax=Marinobacterium lutimaris TaxID=568106 RepID=A0A1H6C8Z1_9GAMM|nr:FAD-binding oxidoreductase [Marinobacterium lutimaris]SEG69095.1 D-amino-acid dehydrogenase [Marinobacterium lutimaris]